MKALVVSYSNSGTTSIVAQRIAEGLGADIDVIEEIKPTPRLVVGGKTTSGAGGAMARAALAALLGMATAIRPANREPSSYELVVIGSPVWVGSVTPAVRAYLKRHRRALPRVAFFCTAGDPTRGRALKQMKKLARQEPVATMAIKADDVLSDACRGVISRFVEEVSTSR